MGGTVGLEKIAGVGRRVTVLALTVSVFAMSTPANAHKSKRAADADQAASAPTQPGCNPTPDQASIGIRALQTELMVAGLKCSAEQFNNFTAKFKATIMTDAARLQRLFSRAYGKAGANQMNSFVTQLANDASQRSNGYSEADYCKQQDVLFHKVLALTGAELERFSAARVVQIPTPVALCRPEPDTPTTVAETTLAPAATTANIR